MDKVCDSGKWVKKLQLSPCDHKMTIITIQGPSCDLKMTIFTLQAPTCDHKIENPDFSLYYRSAFWQFLEYSLLLHPNIIYRVPTSFP